MALSNKFGWLVVATGNKSELSVGYATLYGDMAGGFALLKDVYKTDVFRLARAPERARRPRADPDVDHRARAERRAARRPARRGLAAAVRRSSTSVLEAYVELDRSREELAGDGFDPRRRRARARADRPRRVQAPPGAARREAAPEGVRPRPPHADHEPLDGTRRPGAAGAPTADVDQRSSVPCSERSRRCGSRAGSRDERAPRLARSPASDHQR